MSNIFLAILLFIIGVVCAVAPDKVIRLRNTLGGLQPAVTSSAILYTRLCGAACILGTLFFAYSVLTNHNL